MKNQNLIEWDIYEIHTNQTEIHGVKLRGRIRKFGLTKGFNVLCDNASDVKNCVRFAVLARESPVELLDYLRSKIPGVEIEQVAVAIKNPVLSKLRVNKEERYTL